MLSKLILLGVFCIFTYSKQDDTTLRPTTLNTDSEGTTVLTTTFEPLNSSLASCDDINCTQVNATESAGEKNGTKANKIEKNKKQAHPKRSEDANICTCNLQAHVCNINCCCDPDCSATDKTIFKYCELDENKYYDDKYCNYIKYIYVNNTPFEWEVNQEGLFCVISSNLPASHLVQNEKPINSVELSKTKSQFWPQYQHSELAVEYQSPMGYGSYVFGDPLLIVKNDSSLNYLRIPNNFLTQPCLFKEEILFLKDDKHVCSQIDIADDNDMLSFASFFKNFKIIVNPKLVNWTKGIIYNKCPKNICIEVEPKLCDIHLNNCSPIENVTNTKFLCSFNLQSNLNACQNAVRQIHYKFYHNGSRGLHKVEVLGVLENFSYHFGGEDFHFIQQYSLEFLWINQTKNYSQLFSGNPGYIVGKPILIGTKLLKDNATYIQRNISNFIDNFLVLPESINGHCFKNETYHIPLDFGYNIITKCITHEVIYNVKQNASELCKAVQKSILDLWGIPLQTNQSLMFGLFGNAMTDTVEDWSDIFYSIDPIQGNLTNKNTTLVCRNVPSLLNIEVFYSRVDVKTVLNQNKILGIGFHFNNKRNQTYKLQKKNNTFSLVVSFELVSQVTFHDFTAKKERRFVDPPSLDIRLPYDFFYPFIKIGNGATGKVSSVMTMIWVVCWNILY